MKRHWPIYLLALILGVAAAWFYHSHILAGKEDNQPPESPKGLYERFKDRDGYTVELFKDFRITDSIIVDATVITANDSAGWENLMEEMNVSDFTRGVMRKAIKEGRAITMSYNCKKGHPETKITGKSDEIDMVINYPASRSMFVFDVNSNKQANDIRKHQYMEMF